MQESTFQTAKDHFNKPMMSGMELCRCVGYAEDEEDCYLIVKRPYKDLLWISMVGGYFFFTNDTGSDYCRIDRLLEYNGAPKVQEMIVIDNTEKVVTTPPFPPDR